MIANHRPEFPLVLSRVKITHLLIVCNCILWLHSSDLSECLRGFKSSKKFSEGKHWSRIFHTNLQAVICSGALLQVIIVDKGLTIFGEAMWLQFLGPKINEINIFISSSAEYTVPLICTLKMLDKHAASNPEMKIDISLSSTFNSDSSPSSKIGQRFPKINLQHHLNSSRLQFIHGSQKSIHRTRL